MNGCGASADATSTYWKVSGANLSCFQSADQPPRPKWKENKVQVFQFTGRTSSRTKQDCPSPLPRLLSKGFTLHLPSTSRPARPELAVQITPQINNVPNSFGIISGSFHLLSLFGGDRRGEAASIRRPHIQLHQ